MKISFNWQTAFFTVLVSFILLNLALVDLYILKKGQSVTPVPNSISEFTQFAKETIVPNPISEMPIKNTSPSANIDLNQLSSLVQTATYSLSLKVEELLTKPKVTSTISTLPTNGVKEFYIPLGTGNTQSMDWSDISGVEAYVAPSNYGNVKSMYFEAALRIPSGGGKAYARLIDVTNNNGLFESEISYEGSTGKLISSGNIPVPTTTKLYRVQMRSSIGSLVILDNARIKIFTQ